MTPKNQPANYEIFNHNNHHLPPSLDFTSFSSVHDNYKFFTVRHPPSKIPLYIRAKILDKYDVRSTMSNYLGLIRQSPVNNQTI